jgi:uncharacterized membrane protein
VSTVLLIIVGLVIAASEGVMIGVLAPLTFWLLLHARQQRQELAALKLAVADLQEKQALAPAMPVVSVTPAVPVAGLPIYGVQPMAHELVERASMAPVIAPTEHVVAATPEPDAPVPVPVRGQTEPSPASPAEPPPPPPPVAKFVPRPVYDPFAPVREWLVGGNTIVKLGVAILFIGLAFLARYTADQVAVEVWLAAIAAVAVALLVLGWRLRLRRPGYAQVLQGGAVAILYLTLFAAFRIYELLPVLPVFVMMVAVAALSAALAVLQDARALALLGALGGFATPLLVSSGSGNHIALFSYYLVLDLGIAGVAWFRTWRGLNLVGFLGTFLVGSAWGVLKYQPQHFASSEAFLITYFLLFIAIMLMPARHLDGKHEHPTLGVVWLNGSLLFGLPTITFALQYGLVEGDDFGVALSALALAAFYVAMAAYMRPRPRWAATFEAVLTIGTVFLTLVVPFALDARSTAGAWALEAAGLVWLGFRQQRVVSRVCGYVLLLLACGPLLHAFDRLPTPVEIANGHLFASVLLAVGALASAYFVQRFTAATKSNERVLEPFLIAWGTLWLLVAAGVEIDAFVLESRHWLAAWLTTVSAIALSYVALADALRWKNITAPVLAHAPVLALCVAVSAEAFTSPGAWGGWWAWPLALLTHVVVLWRAAPRWSTAGQTVAHATGALVLAALGSLQGRAITRAWGDVDSAWAWLGWLAVPALLLLLLTRPAALRVWPVRAAPVAYRAIAGGVLTAGLFLWILAANFVSNGSAAPLTYVPLLSPLDLGVGVALLAAWLWIRGDAVRDTLGDSVDALRWMFWAVGFLWLNAAMVRGFHHHGGVPFDADTMAASQAVQTGFTLLWAVLALIVMWIAVRRAARAPWMVGAGLLALVIVKLLAVDLAASDTVTRIISFIGVGVLMLVIGFVAPLPATGRPHAEKPEK